LLSQLAARGLKVKGPSGMKLVCCEIVRVHTVFPGEKRKVSTFDGAVQVA
jgi:hypothetical protein